MDHLEGNQNCSIRFSLGTRQCSAFDYCYLYGVVLKGDGETTNSDFVNISWHSVKLIEILKSTGEICLSLKIA